MIHSEVHNPWDRAFRRLGLGTAADHHVHHRTFIYNYGHTMMWWDRLAGTYKAPDSVKNFDLSGAGKVQHTACCVCFPTNVLPPVHPTPRAPVHSQPSAHPSNHASVYLKVRGGSMYELTAEETARWGYLDSGSSGKTE